MANASSRWRKNSNGVTGYYVFQEASDRSISPTSPLTSSDGNFTFTRKGNADEDNHVLEPGFFRGGFGASFSKDHTLITPFQYAQKSWATNCHLQAEFTGDRRLRQPHEVPRNCSKKSSIYFTDCVIVCGDFNSKSDEALAPGHIVPWKWMGFEEHGKPVISVNKTLCKFSISRCTPTAYTGKQTTYHDRSVPIPGWNRRGRQRESSQTQTHVEKSSRRITCCCMQSPIWDLLTLTEK